MLAILAASIFDVIPQAASPDDQRVAVYVWAVIVGFITSGVISIIKETRAAARARV